MENTQHLSIQDLYRLGLEMKGNPPIELSEEELKTDKSVKKQKCIFANEKMMEKYESLPPDVKDRFKAYGEDYYSKIIDNIQGTIENSAQELLCSVRSGISPKDLNNNDLQILRTIYGSEWFKLANLESENDD